jgi:sec-independent protein translocase protein TatA
MPTIVQANLLSPEILIVVGLVVLLFGGSKLPELAKGLGQSMKDFKKAVNEEPEEKKEETASVPAAPATPDKTA